MHLVHLSGNTSGVSKSLSDWLDYTGFSGDVCHVLKHSTWKQRCCDTKHPPPPPRKKKAVMFTTVTMSAYQDKVLDFQKYVKCLKFAAYNLCNTSASFTHRFDIVATFPRPETWHWMKWTVIGCLTCRSNGIMGGPWPMKAAICSSRSAISLKAWHLQQQTATSRSLLNAFKSLLQVKTSTTIKFIIFKVHKNFSIFTVSYRQHGCQQFTVFYQQKKNQHCEIKSSNNLFLLFIQWWNQASILFWCDLKIENKKFAKRRIGIQLDRVKMSTTHIFYHLQHQSWQQLIVFCNVDQPNHTLLGGVGENSLCHQVGLFALSVNRHSVYVMPIE